MPPFYGRHFCTQLIINSYQNYYYIFPFQQVETLARAMLSFVSPQTSWMHFNKLMPVYYDTMFLLS